jgi:hypothetical protein
MKNYRVETEVMLTVSFEVEAYDREEAEELAESAFCETHLPDDAKIGCIQDHPTEYRIKESREG